MTYKSWTGIQQTEYKEFLSQVLSISNAAFFLQFIIHALHLPGIFLIQTKINSTMLNFLKCESKLEDGEYCLFVAMYIYDWYELHPAQRAEVLTSAYFH